MSNNTKLVKSPRILLVLTIAVRYLFSAKGRRKLPSMTTVLSFCGVSISVAILVVVMSVMNGFYSQFVRIVIGISPHVSIFGAPPVSFANEDGMLRIASSAQLRPLLSHYSPSVSGNGMATSHNGQMNSGILIQGLRVKDFKTRNLLKESIISGDFTEGGVVLGKDLAQHLYTKVGDKITIIIPKGRTTLFGTIPIHKKYTVTGIFSVKMYHYDRNVAFLDLDSASRLLGYEDGEFTSYDLFLKDISKTDLVTKITISEFIKTRLPGGVKNWKNQNKSFMDAIRLQSNVMFFILILFVILSSFIILSGTSNMINAKTKSITILQTMGLSTKEVTLIFLVNGIIISILGILFGCAAGSITAYNIENIKNFLERTTGKSIFDAAYYFLSYIPSEVRMEDIFKISLLCFLISLAAIIIPLRKLKKFSLQTFLRHE